MKFFYYDAYDIHGMSTGGVILINIYHVQEFRIINGYYFPVLYNVIHEFGMNKFAFEKIQSLL